MSRSTRLAWLICGCCAAATSAGAVLGRGAPQGLQPCGAAPSAVRDVPGIGYYVDERRSVRDATLFRSNRDALEQVDRYHGTLAELADAAAGGDKLAARCAAGMLLKWVNGRALLGSAETRQARSQRRWSAAAMSLVSIKLWGFLRNDERSRVATYLLQLVEILRREADADRVRNNHLYWTAVTYQAAGVLARRPAVSDEAIRICRAATGELTWRGSLPLEDRRGDRALDYNGFALFPLAAVAALGNDAGCSPKALMPLASFLMENRAKVDSRFMRWAPILGVPVELDDKALFYPYGGGDLTRTSWSLRRMREEGHQ